MDRGLYVAASGMLSELARQEQLTNDLANATTPGYKADRVAQRSFGEVMLQSSSGEQLGTASRGVGIMRSVTDLRPQALKETGEPLDLAVSGEGWFAVRTPQGERYTRNGAFAADAAGQLVDQMGNAVLGPGRQPVRVGADGQVDPASVGVFAVDGLRKQGDALFAGQATGAAAGSVRTGSLEGSGVDPTRTVVDLMASLRAYEAGQKALTTIDESLRQGQRVVTG